MNTLPYSYHTFLFPFLWNDGGKMKWEDFKEKLSFGDRWVETSWKGEQIPDNKNQTEWLQDYAAHQYFTEAANGAIFNTRGDNTIRCFDYQNKGKLLKNTKNTGKYVIIKEKSEKNESEVFPINARLDIYRIRLHIYNCGVAILIFELENYQHKSIDEINAINEYGRRINMPYFDLKKAHSICADRIEILFGDTVFERENYKETLDALREDFQSKIADISLDFVMKPIQKLIGGDSEIITTKKSEAAKDSEKVYIKPCVDDRMFVCCLIREDKAFKNITDWDSSSCEYTYLSACKKDDHDKPDLLYKTMFIENSITCASRRMKKELLAASVYDRWIDYGTLYAVTHHSFICITGEDNDLKWDLESKVYNPFLTQYVQLAILVLAQRAAILALSGGAASVAEGLQDNISITLDYIGKIESLQAKYVKIQSQLLLSEATVQEQGVEIYNLIREHLYIEGNKAELDKQLNSLWGVANISNTRMLRIADEGRNKLMFWLSVLAVLLGFAPKIPSILSRDTEIWIKIYSGVLVFFYFFVIFQISRYPHKPEWFKRKKK